MTIYDNFFGLANLLYGDITNMDDMFLPPLDSEPSETDDTQEEQELAKRKEDVFKFEELDYLRPKAMTADVAEFNDITRILQNETRRYNGRWRGWTDNEDVEWSWVTAIFGANATYGIENRKKKRMSNMNLQWIVHARIVVKKALVLKRADDLRLDKRYKIGYLMSRLRIIKYEQQKITSFAQALEKHYSRSLKALLKFYERMVRYDVDIKDTVRFIREIDKKPSPIANVSSKPTRP
nr:uncharacterized protein LOC117988378 [Maniola hyperantus]